MIDFHCHLDLYPSPHEIAAAAQREGTGVLSVTTTPTAWTGTARLSEDRPAIKTALGLHPQLASARKHELGQFEQLLPNTPFVGEVGLDGSPEHRTEWADQAFVFRRILEICSEGPPKLISIHSRRAAAPVLDLLDAFPDIHLAVLHWFSGTHKQLDRAISRDCWFSVGPAMLASAKGRSLVNAMPKERIVLETDGPFAEVQRAGLKPWDVAQCVDPLADIWDVSKQEAEGIVLANARALLRPLDLV